MEIALGQIWKVVGRNSDRMVKVVARQGNWVRIQTVASGGKPRVTWAMAKRFHGMVGGYVFVADDAIECEKRMIGAALGIRSIQTDI